jgi:DNA primase
MRSENIIETIRERLDIVEVIRDYIPLIQKAGKNFKALCPFHNEKTPSFTINPDTQRFYCFGCQEHGDVFSFIEKIDGLTFMESAMKLASKAGVQWEGFSMKAMTENDRMRIELKKVMELASIFYSRFLTSSNAVRAAEYLKNRNVSKDSIEKFRIGFSPLAENMFVNEATKRGFSKELLIKAGLAYVKENGQITDYFRGRIMFPIKNAIGDVIAFGARALGDFQPKYLNSPETPLFSKRKTLYGIFEALRDIRKEKKILLLEGYMDVISAHQNGISFALAPLGTAFSHEHASLAKRYSKDIVVMFDGDTAGQNAAIKAGEIFMESGLYVKIAALPDGLDPDDFLIKHGADDFKKQLDNAGDIINFKLNLHIKDSPRNIPAQEKSKITKIILETVAKQNDEIVKNEWTKTIAEKLDIPQETVLAELKKINYGNKEKYSAPKEEVSFEETPALELGLIHMFLKEPELISYAEKLNEENLQSDFAKKIVTIIRNMVGENHRAIINKLIADLPDYAAKISKLSHEEINDDVSTEQVMRTSVTMLVRASKKRRRTQLRKKGFSKLTPEEFSELNKLNAE